MARTRGNPRSGPEPPEPPADEEGRLPPLPDLVRRLFTVGFSGFFLTEGAIRRALGDTLPKEWQDFAVEQSDRTRAEFVERLSYEMARVFEDVDWAAALETLLEGRTLEVRADIRLAPREEDEEGRARPRARVSTRRKDR